MLNLFTQSLALWLCTHLPFFIYSADAYWILANTSHWVTLGEQPRVQVDMIPPPWSYRLVQRSANFLSKELGIEYCSCCKAIRCLSQLLSCAVVVGKQPLTIHKWMDMAMFQWSFNYRKQTGCWTWPVGHSLPTSGLEPGLWSQRELG